MANINDMKERTEMQSDKVTWQSLRHAFDYCVLL